jgi:hypothetical protein
LNQPNEAIEGATVRCDRHCEGVAVPTTRPTLSRGYRERLQERLGKGC